MDWESESTEFLINPKFPEEEKQFLLDILKKAPHLKSHIWLLTSGSSAENIKHHKWVALSKEGLLASAQAVNQHIHSQSSDIWAHALPNFHVGGLAIWARAFLTGAKVILYENKWSPHLYHEFLTETKSTLSSLVPTQIYDLVLHHLRSPPHLRALFVGGGKLGEDLYQKACNLGWPILVSYGLTECASQIACSELGCEIPRLKIHSHIQLKIEENGFISIQSPSLLTLYAYWKDGNLHCLDPKVKSWFQTEDKGELLKRGYLKVFGRDSNFIKIGGESVDLLTLESILDKIKLEERIQNCDFALIPVPDERLGHVIHLCTDAPTLEAVQSLVDKFQSKVLPFAKIRKVHTSIKIPRTPLMKVCREILLKTIDLLI